MKQIPLNIINNLHSKLHVSTFSSPLRAEAFKEK